MKFRVLKEEMDGDAWHDANVDDTSEFSEILAKSDITNGLPKRTDIEELTKLAYKYGVHDRYIERFIKWYGGKI